MDECGRKLLVGIWHTFWIKFTQLLHLLSVPHVIVIASRYYVILLLVLAMAQSSAARACLKQKMGERGVGFRYTLFTHPPPPPPNSMIRASTPTPYTLYSLKTHSCQSPSPPSRRPIRIPLHLANHNLIFLAIREHKQASIAAQ